MTVTGLASVNLSSLTPWQQTIIFLQMCLGNPVSLISTSTAKQSTEIFKGSYLLGNCLHPQVSQILLSASSLHFVDLKFRYFFAKKFQHVLETKKAADLLIQPTENYTKSWLNRSMAFVTGYPVVVPVDVDAVVDKEGGLETKRKLTPDMIRRVDEPPKPINPSGNSSGWVSERRASHRTIPPGSGPSFTSPLELFEDFSSNGYPATSGGNRRRLSDPGPITRMLYFIKKVIQT